MSELDACQVVPGGASDVIEAAKSGNLELVKNYVLADAGCVHMADDEYADSLLRARAALYGTFPCVYMGFFPNPLFCSNWSALTFSSNGGFLEITRFLVASGANLEMKDSRCIMFQIAVFIMVYFLQFLLSEMIELC